MKDIEIKDWIIRELDTLGVIHIAIGNKSVEWCTNKDKAVQYLNRQFTEKFLVNSISIPVNVKETHHESNTPDETTLENIEGRGLCL